MMFAAESDCRHGLPVDKQIGHPEGNPLPPRGENEFEIIVA